jgi:photosystem II stability/assembly factor-like uncharacterized protein
VESKRLIAAAALVAFFVVALALARAAAGFEPEATVRRVDRLAFLALARVGNRIVAAGERGRIVFSDDAGATWNVASSPSHATLTSLTFVDERNGFATGHEGTILLTGDGGQTWHPAALSSDEKPALFALRMDGGHGIAVGGYGAYFETNDSGHTWTARRVMARDFDRHLTGIAACGSGCLLIAGEAGTLLRSTDAGATWQLLPAPYQGSFFGAVGAVDGTVIAFGMRGNAFRSRDRGNTWQRVDLGGYTGALQGGLVDNGRIVLTGADGFVAASRDGTSFDVGGLPSRATVSARLIVAGRALHAGPAGLAWAEARP